MSGNKARHHVTKTFSYKCRIDFLFSVLCRPGGPSGGIPPDPIPNSAVKAPSAHGTAAQAAGESVAARSAKDAFINPAFAHTPALVIVRRRRPHVAGWSSPVARQAHNLKV